MSAYKWPATPGGRVDHLYKLQQQRIALKAQERLISAEEEALEQTLIKEFGKAKVEGMRGKLGQAYLDRKVVPRVTDWEKYWGHIKKTGHFDLLQKRPGEVACQERWDEGKNIPGCEQFPIVQVKVSRLGKK